MKAEQYLWHMIVRLLLLVSIQLVGLLSCNRGDSSDVLMNSGDSNVAISSVENGKPAQFNIIIEDPALDLTVIETVADSHVLDLFAEESSLDTMILVVVSDPGTLPMELANLVKDGTLKFRGSSLDFIIEDEGLALTQSNWVPGSLSTKSFRTVDSTTGKKLDPLTSTSKPVKGTWQKGVPVSSNQSLGSYNSTGKILESSSSVNVSQARRLDLHFPSEKATTKGGRVIVSKGNSWILAEIPSGVFAKAILPPAVAKTLDTSPPAALRSGFSEIVREFRKFQDFSNNPSSGFKVLTEVNSRNGFEDDIAGQIKKQINEDPIFERASREVNDAQDASTAFATALDNVWKSAWREVDSSIGTSALKSEIPEMKGVVVGDLHNRFVRMVQDQNNMDELFEAYTEVIVMHNKLSFRANKIAADFETMERKVNDLEVEEADLRERIKKTKSAYFMTEKSKVQKIDELSKSLDQVNTNKKSLEIQLKKSGDRKEYFDKIYDRPVDDLLAQQTQLITRISMSIQDLSKRAEGHYSKLYREKVEVKKAEISGAATAFEQRLMRANNQADQDLKGSRAGVGAAGG